MQAGRLRELVTIQQQSVTRDEYGAEVIAWVDVATVWASVLPKASGERFISGAAQELAKISHTVRVRYRSGITPKMRLAWGSRLLYVETLTDPNGRRRELVLMCEEEQV